MLVAKLKEMVGDCAERKVPFHFGNIIDGLMLTGRSYTRALADLIPAVRCRSIRTSKEILKLILHPRNGNIDPFVTVIDSIRSQDHFKFPNEWINRLLIIQSQKKNANAALNATIFELINGVDQKGMKALDQELFTKFIESMAKSIPTTN